MSKEISQTTERLTDFLARFAVDGLFSYHAGGEPALEPSAIGLIACSSNAELRKLTLKSILAKQNNDGGWATNFREASSDWSTFPAVIGLQNYLKNGDFLKREISDSLSRANNFILNSRAEYYNDLGRMLLWLWKGADYDYPRGFSWLPETADWVEPTSYAMIALKSGSELSDAQKRSITVAERFLTKIACPEGGWNFGEHYPVGQSVAADPVSTALALLALAGSKPTAVTKSSLKYLSNIEIAKRGSLSLAWSVLALNAWKERYDHILDRLLVIYQTPFKGTEKMLPVALAVIAFELENRGNPFVFQQRTV